MKFKNSGTPVIFLETDFEKVKPFDKNFLSSVQMEVFSKLSATEQEKIKARYGTIISDLESGTDICKFNMENYISPEKPI